MPQLPDGAAAFFMSGTGEKIKDFEVILKVLSGNRDAYADIVRRYQERVRGYCLSMLADEALADDAAQEVFIKAYQSLGLFKGNSLFSTWIYRITSNHCVDVLRKLKRKTVSWEALLEKEGEKIEALVAVAPEKIDPGTPELIAKILSHLSEKTREILILREMHGLSYQEIAESLGCSLDAVKSRLKRAREELEMKMRHLLELKDV